MPLEYNYTFVYINIYICLGKKQWVFDGSKLRREESQEITKPNHHIFLNISQKQQKIELFDVRKVLLKVVRTERNLD